MSDEMKREIEQLKSAVADLRETDKRIARAVVRIEGKLDRFEDSFRAAFKEGTNAVIARLDEASAEIRASRRERALQGQTFNLLNERLTDHELRIHRLESRAPDKKS